MTLHLLQYNNYYNRVIKFYDTLDEYKEYIIDGAEFPNINFMPNDGVSTEQIIEWDGAPPDYLIVADEDKNINSRWYVIEAVRLRHSQYKLSLYRDLMVDFYNDIISAPIFLEKAPLSANNPLLFNQENMTFNQIRKEPTLLYDNSECPWVVGYIPRDSNIGEVVSTIGVSAQDADIEVDGLESWDYFGYINGVAHANISSNVRIRYIIQASNLGATADKPYKYSQCTLDISKTNYEKTETTTTNPNDISSEFLQNNYKWSIASGSRPNFRFEAMKNAIYNNSTTVSYIDGLVQSTYNPVSKSLQEELEELNSKIIADTSTNTFYEISVDINSFTSEVNTTGSLNTNLKDAFLNNVWHAQGTQIYAPTSGDSSKCITLVVNGTYISLSLKQIFLELKTTITEDRYHLEDQPYDMFCIPYGEITMTNDSTIGFLSQGSAAMIATYIAEKVGANKIYDVQLLPYCPISWSFFEGSNVVNLNKIKYNLIYNSNDEPVSAVLWCRSSSFRAIINHSISVSTNSVVKKINAETKIHRLVSPNFNGMFEFTPEKNGGVDYFIADCTYKPINPYIRVAPVFKELYGYGGDYDGRGLILGGDFSLPKTTTAWAEYESQNKNYLNIFNRQLDNMDITNKAQRITDIAQALSGAASTAAGGVIAGSMAGSAGGAAGMAIGGALGGLAGIGTGVIDLVMSEKLRNEAIDYTKDQFGYQLGNIQALPISLAKTSAFSKNNSLVPMLEVYECSEVEKQALISKIQYNGMTVMTIGTIEEYLPNKQFDLDYFKGKIIRFNNLGDDTHIANAIANELNKGVYL